MMRWNSLRAVAATAFVAVAAGACDQGLTDLNRNPNAPDFATPEQLFPNAVEASVSRVFGSGLHMDLTALLVQHYAEHEYQTEDLYQIGDGAVSGHWSSFYIGPLQDFQETIEQGVEAGRPNVAAVGTIMQQWTFHVMTDLWGDIGYSDALRGRDPSAGNTPKLDPQAVVYDGILAALKKAHSDLDPSAFALTRSDLIYKGDISKWQKFANSLRLRVAMRLSEVDPDRARVEFTEALAAGVFTSNADNAKLTYVNDEINVHPIYAYERSRNDHSVSATMIDTLKAFSDPRLPIYAKPNTAGEYRGTPNGVNKVQPIDSVSRIGHHFSKADASAVIMSYAEVLFLQAEAAERGWIAGDPASLYAQAITAAMQDLGIEQAEIDAYLAQPKVAYNGLESIGLQKWIALYGNGPEAYAEWRRTGYPALTPGPDAENGGLIPVRLPYPISEARRNGANLQEAIDRQGGATLNHPLWWDK